jgi:titin
MSRIRLRRSLAGPRVETLENRLLLSIVTVTNTVDSGPGSLRQAILDANADPYDDSIVFNIGGGGVQIIQPNSYLPEITKPVVIDGTTQPGYVGSPLIVLDGINAGSRAAGLTLSGGHSAVEALDIGRFDSAGILLQTNGSDLILANYIGADVTGTRNFHNGAGVQITSPNNTVGGTSPGAGNLISGNQSAGIAIENASNNLVAGNLIGTDVTGTHFLANGGGGVNMHGAGSNNNEIGGTTPAARNVISGNVGDAGIRISDGAEDNCVQGNYVGTDLTGVQFLPNQYGIYIDSANNNLIGGREPSAGNVISGNNVGGVTIVFATGNRIQGNQIGTDARATMALGNQMWGVFLAACSGNLIGGATAGAGNVISGNAFVGMYFAGNADSNVVQGNYIGTDGSGTLALGNGQRPGAGIYIFPNNNDNLIGGTDPGAGNLVSGNLDAGVIVAGTGTVLRGNLIGTDDTGSVALPNGDGVVVDANQVVIGGTIEAARNIISGNNRDGIIILGSDCTAILIQGNRIGTDVTGAFALGNGANGVVITGGAHDNVVGAANTIAYNGGDGVLVDAGTGNAVRRNAILASGNLGIELSNNGNHGQEYPVLTSALSDDSSTTVEGTLTSAASRTFTIEFFADSVCNPSGYGEGERFLGSATVTTDAQGNAGLTFTVALVVAPGQFISATATDPDNNTSEFSQCVTVFGLTTRGLAVNVTAFEPSDAALNRAATSMPATFRPSSTPNQPDAVSDNAHSHRSRKAAYSLVARSPRMRPIRFSETSITGITSPKTASPRTLCPPGLRSLCVLDSEIAHQKSFSRAHCHFRNGESGCSTTGASAAARTRGAAPRRPVNSLPSRQQPAQRCRQGSRLQDTFTFCFRL